jgi:hypothetical protein
MRTTTLAALTLATATLMACIQETEHPIKDALPTAEAVSIKLPGASVQAGDSGAPGVGSGSYAILGQTAQFYQVTRGVTLTLNAGAAWVLVVVHAVVQFPPTTVEGNVYTWGPGSGPLDPADWRLVVTDNADGSYSWSLDGRSKITPEDGFITVIDGVAVPGAEPHRGRGSFSIDFDAGERVNPIDNDARGTVDVEYDLENRDGTQATLDMHIEGVADDGRPVSFDYHYAENKDRSGDFSFAIHGDLDDDGTASEDAEIRSRWLDDGQGRSDVALAGGDLGDLEVSATECWDTRFARVYYTDSVQWQPTEGDANQCVF